MVAWKLGPALATGKAVEAVNGVCCLAIEHSSTTGNCIVLKTSEKTPVTALKMCEFVEEAGFPSGVLNILSGGGAAGHHLASHMAVKKIAFTGSTTTGRKVMEAAAKSNLKKVSLELGGKSPQIVFPGD